MNKQEVYWTPLGEMLDMISCLFIDEGRVKEKKPKMSMEEFLKLE